MKVYQKYGSESFTPVPGLANDETDMRETDTAYDHVMILVISPVGEQSSSHGTAHNGTPDKPLTSIAKHTLLRRERPTNPPTRATSGEGMRASLNRTVF